MREIKFRAWYEHTPIMIYVDPKANSQSYGKVESNAELFRLADINNYELMQYTGLKDKNEVEIYQSDITSFTNRSGDTISRTCEWSEKENGWRFDGFNYTQEFINNNAVVVTGNTYEDR